jgi:ABC-type multidrug transport system fused ATPase/permease subunit
MEETTVRSLTASLSSVKYHQTSLSLLVKDSVTALRASDTVLGSLTDSSSAMRANVLYGCLWLFDLHQVEISRFCVIEMGRLSICAYFADLATHMYLVYLWVLGQTVTSGFQDSVIDLCILCGLRCVFKWNPIIVKCCMVWCCAKIVYRLLDIDSGDDYASLLNGLALSLFTTCLTILPLDGLKLPTFRPEYDPLIPEEHPQNTMVTYYSVMYSLLKSELPMMIVGVVVNMIRMPFSMSLPYWISTAFGALLNHDSELLYHCTLFCFICGSVDALLDFWCVFIFSLVQNRISRRLRTLLFSKILSQPMTYFDTTPSGELMSRLTSDTAAAANQLSWTCRWISEALIRVSGITAYLFLSSWRLATLVCCLIPINSLVAKKYGAWSARNSAKAQDALASANAFAQETLAAVGTVKAFCGEKTACEKYGNLLSTFFQYQLREAAVSGGYYMIVSTFLMTTVTQAALLGYGGFLVLRNRLLAETLVSFILYRGQLQEWCSAVLENYAATLRSAGAGTKIIALLNQPSERVGGELSSGGLVEFDRVSFRYEARPEAQVLRDVSFEVRPGQVVCLVGQSGSGKTSLFALLQGLYAAESGDIKVGGVSLSVLDLECLRKRVLSVVAQDPLLFRGSIRDNLIYGLGTGSIADLDLRIAKALEVSCSSEFVNNLPGGLECMIGERGVQLSGGQKQRLAIARAVLMDPAILLLDEATSSLDAEAERTVQQALENSMKGRTTIMISHKLSTAVKYADWIVVIGKGTVIEQGTPQQLLANSDISNPYSFGSLLKLQS